MPRTTNAALRKAAILWAVLLGLAVLPGCAVVGPLLSMGGMAGLAPLQYASTAMTVGEFTYEYAAHGKDPSEVVEGKILSVLDGSAFALPGLGRTVDGPDPVVVADAGEATAASADPTKVETVEAAISAEARQQRIRQLLGRRDLQFERLELRRLAFLRARDNGDLTLRQTAMAASPDLIRSADGRTTLRE